MFVKRFVPELAAFPKKYVYEPWRAPVADQKRWGCLIRGEGQGEGGGEEDGEGGGDGEEGAEGEGGAGKHESGIQTYPKPMFDFNERRGICIQGMKTAYHIGLYGDDHRVKDGSWRQLFTDDAEGPTEGTQGPTVEGQTNTGGSEAVDTADMDMGEDEDEREAEHGGGENRGGDDGVKGGKRKRGRQGTLDGHFVSPGKKKGGRG